jgi:hypothetical protein
MRAGFKVQASALQPNPKIDEGGPDQLSPDSRMHAELSLGCIQASWFISLGDFQAVPVK